MIRLIKLQSWTKAVETISEKNLFRWTHEFFNLQFSHFDHLSPVQCCNRVTVSKERISTLRRGRGGLAVDQKKNVFFIYRPWIQDVWNCLTWRYDRLYPLSNPAILSNLTWRFLVSWGERESFHICTTTDPYCPLRQERERVLVLLEVQMRKVSRKCFGILDLWRLDGRKEKQWLGKFYTLWSTKSAEIYM